MIKFWNCRKKKKSKYKDPPTGNYWFSSYYVSWWELNSLHDNWANGKLEIWKRQTCLNCYCFFFVLFKSHLIYTFFHEELITLSNIYLNLITHPNKRLIKLQLTALIMIKVTQVQATFMWSMFYKSSAKVSHN